MGTHTAVHADITSAVNDAIERTISTQGELGLAVAVYLDGQLIADARGGIADETTGAPVLPDTVFNTFSVTKALTATAVHVLAERGHIEYDQPVARYWPEFAANGKSDALVAHALSHRIGLPAMPDGVTIERMCDYEDMVASIAAMAPLFPVGTKSPYHGYTFGWIVGELVRRTDPQGRRVDRFITEEICTPLGIENLWLGIPPEIEPRIARLRDDTRRLPLDTDPATLTSPQQIAMQAIPGPVRTTPENFMRPDVRAACLPGVGAIADAPSIARFFALLAGGGELDGTRLLSEERLRWCCTRPEPVPNDEFDLDDKIIGRGGYHLPVPNNNQPSYYHAIGQGPGIITHSGSGGQLAWADLDTQLAVAILRNRMTSPTNNPTTDPLTTIANATQHAISR
jgi:CubicO group peptidase (beta-lactamase class C family)